MISFGDINSGYRFTGNVTENLVESTENSYKMVSFTDNEGQAAFARLYWQDVPLRLPFLDLMKRTRTVLTTQSITFKLKLCISDTEGLTYYRAIDVLSA
jgi:hypothetical protein